VLVLLRDERGQVLPFVALSALVLILTTGLVLVAGLSYAYAELVQQAADAGALAGAHTADVTLYFEDPLTGLCNQLSPSDGAIVPCRFEVTLDPALARAQAIQAVQLNESGANFAGRGLQVTNVQVSTFGSGSSQAGVTVIVEAEARVPMLELFGRDHLVIRRRADSEVGVNCGGAC